MLTLCVIVTVGIISVVLRNYFTKKPNGSKGDDSVCLTFTFVYSVVIYIKYILEKNSS